MPIDDAYFLNIAYEQALIARDLDEVPVGACIVLDNKVIATGYNSKENNNDVLGHAEINAIKSAQIKQQTWRLLECTLYSTLEPCPMCSGAILQSRIKRVVYGAKDFNWGAHQSKINIFKEDTYNHNTLIDYHQDEKCGQILKNYFKSKRK